MEAQHYDIIVIGAGSAGLTAAITLQSAGKQVLLVERDKPGGECTHSGCVPSKALLHIAQNQYRNNETDSAQAMAYVQKTIYDIYQHETPEKLEKHGIHFVRGEAVFSGTHTITIDQQEYHYGTCIIATGSSPRMLEIPGLDTEHVLTNQNFFEQPTLPERLLVIGSGPIGMELAQAAAMLGSKVSIVTTDDELGVHSDPSIRPLIAERCSDLGIESYLHSTITHVQGTTAQVESQTTPQEHHIEFDKILVAVGRVPNIPQGLEVANITSTQQGITVDKQYRTTNRHIYAIGDVAQKDKFTHTANHVGRGIARHILSRGLLGQQDRAVPRVTYTNPEIAQVGMTYNQAVDRYGRDALVRIETPLSGNDRATTDQQTNGLVVVVAKRLSGRVLGAEIYAAHAGELINYYTLAIDQGVSLWRISSTIFPYPTLSGVVKKTADQFATQTAAGWRQELRYLVRSHASKLVALVFWGALLSWVVTMKSMYDMGNIDLLRMAYEWIESHPATPLLFVVVYILRPLIFFPATLLTALSGALFGLPLGILYTVLGENASANLAYWIGRFFGRGTHLEDNRLFGRFIHKAQDEPFIAVLLMRFLYVPFDLSNYGSGIARIPWAAYATATVIGIMPGLVTFVALGASIDIDTLLGAESISDLGMGINPIMLAVSLGLFVASLGLARYFKKKHT